MKIALVCPASLPAIQFGGILHLTVNMAKEFSKMGHDVTIFTTDLDAANDLRTFNKKLLREEKINGFNINRTHCWFSIYLFYINPEMYWQLLNYRPDIIHSIGLRSFQSLIATLVAKKKKISLVISDQGGLLTHPEIKEGKIIRRILYKLQIPLIKFIIDHARRITVGNEYEKEMFSKFNVDSKISIVRNGIDLEELKTSSENFRQNFNLNDRYILFVGRFAKSKGIDILLNAMNLIKNNISISNVKLVIMGVDDGFETEMKKIIEEFHLQDKVMIIRKPKREDVIAAYKDCEFIVLPSRWELSPLVPLEGFFFKKPIVATNVHGNPFTIKHRENGILVEPENYQQFANAILELLIDDKKRILYGLSGYEFVKNVCNSAEMAKNTLKIYNEIAH